MTSQANINVITANTFHSTSESRNILIAMLNEHEAKIFKAFVKSVKSFGV